MSQQLSPLLADSGQPLALHLVEEISHRVVNEYTEAIAILSLAASRGHAPADLALARTANRLRAYAESHRALLTPVANCPIDLGAHIGKLCASLSRASLEERGIRLNLSVDEIWIDSTLCWRVGLIVSELIRNAVRHGLHDRSGTIGVDIRRDALRVQCTVSDDGCAATNPTEGRGRRLVRAIATELQGSISWRFTTSGTIVNFEFPLVQPKAIRHAGA